MNDHDKGKYLISRIKNTVINHVFSFLIGVILVTIALFPAFTNKDEISESYIDEDTIEDVLSTGDPPELPDNIEAYHYWYAPENSFGIQEMKTVNWSYFKSLFLAHTDWMLEYKRYDYSDWTDGSDYLTIERTWNESGFWKFNLIPDVPVYVYSARFTFGIDLPCLQYVEREGYEVWINYTANATETYSVMFNWSDIASIPGLVITKGTQDGMFWFRFRRDNIPAGHYEFDPIFGEKKEKQVKYDFYSPSMNETLEVFYNEPKLSLHRWDKECYLNVSAIPTKDTVVFADSSDYKLKWIEDEKEYHFYPLVNNSFEYEVILNEKPDTNIVSLDIDSTNLNFYYQPPLNESLNLSNYDFVNETHAIKNGSVVIYRPENVVGSYAVYHSSKTGHVIGQTNYKTGKAFHIYRPKVFDADGSWTWGILSIDEDTGILSVEISQDFFDEAVYPVTIDPDFGYTSEGSTNLGGPGDMLFGYLFASPATAGMTGVSMNMYGYYQGSSANVKMLIYPYTDGLTYITNGITGAVALTDISSLKTATFGTAPSIAASTNYLLTVIADLDFYIKGDNAGGTEKQDWSNSYATPTNFNWDGGSSTKGSIYCTYEVAEENNAPTQSGESPTNSSTDISITPTLNVTVDDADDDWLNVTWWSNSSGDWVQFASNSSLDGSNLPTNIIQDNSNFSAYSTTYYWSVNVSDGTDWVNETYHFTTETGQFIDQTINGSYTSLITDITVDTTINGSYTSLIIDTIVDTSINGSYKSQIVQAILDQTVNGSYKVDLIESQIIDQTINGSYTTLKSSHIISQVINGSYVVEPVTSQIINQTINGSYVTETISDHIVSQIINGSYKTLINEQIISQTINGSYTSLKPSRIISQDINGSYQVTPISDQLIDDTINGSYQSLQSERIIDQSINGSYTTVFESNIISTDINGSYVDVNSVPTQSNHLIWNSLTEKTLNATYVNVTSTSINFTIGDPDLDTMNWYIYQNYTNLVESGSSTNATISSVNVSWFRPQTNYSLSFNVTDSYLWSNVTRWFVTDYSVPQFSDENPSNGSIIYVTTYNWSITIIDFVPFNWTVDCSNGQSSSGNMDTNGTFSLSLTNLVTYTTYTIWVNATNGNLTINASYIFTVMPPPVTPGNGGWTWIPSVREEEEPEPIVDEVTMLLTGIAIVVVLLVYMFLIIYERRKEKGKK